MKLDNLYPQNDKKPSVLSLETLKSLLGRFKFIDYWILAVYIILTCFSIILVYSTSHDFSLKNFNDAAYLFHKHLAGVFFSVLAVIFGFIFSDRFLKKNNTLISFLIIFLLLAPLVPSIGLSIGSSNRWVQIGFLNFQPSEIAKILIIFYIAYQLSFKNQIHSLCKELTPTLVFIAVGGLLILFQKDFSTSIIFFTTVLGMFFINNFPYKDLLKILAFAFIGFLPFILFTPYRLERITMLFNLESNPASAYQIVQSLGAFNRGGFLGLGPGQGNNNIPYVFNDFVFAAIGEEFGFIGALFIIILFFILIQRSLKISKALSSQSDQYSALIVFGIATSLGVQTLINIAVNMAMIFPTGVTLPFLSYGRTSLIISSFCIGLLLKYSYKIEKPKKIS